VYSSIYPHVTASAGSSVVLTPTPAAVHVAAAAAAAAVAAAAAPPAPAATIPGGVAPAASHVSPRIFSIQQSCDTATPAPEPTLATVLGASNNPGRSDEPLDANAAGNDSEEIAPPLPPPSSATFSLSPLAVIKKCWVEV
jgi:hypothetical protein